MKIDRRRVYRKFTGKCAYCGIEIDFKQMQVDHLWPKSLSHFKSIKDPDRFDNLMPACQKCNNHKGGMRIEVWRNELQLQIKRLRKNAQFDRALRYEQLLITEKPIAFYFETKL